MRWLGVWSVLAAWVAGAACGGEVGAGGGLSPGRTEGVVVVQTAGGGALSDGRYRLTLVVGRSEPMATQEDGAHRLVLGAGSFLR